MSDLRTTGWRHQWCDRCAKISHQNTDQPKPNPSLASWIASNKRS